MFNDICERVVKYWEEKHEILPEIFNLRADEIEEVVDGIEDKHFDLLGELLTLCVH